MINSSSEEKRESRSKMSKGRHFSEFYFLGYSCWPVGAQKVKSRKHALPMWKGLAARAVIELNIYDSDGHLKHKRTGSIERGLVCFSSRNWKNGSCCSWKLELVGTWFVVELCKWAEMVSINVMLTNEWPGNRTFRFVKKMMFRVVSERYFIRMHPST